MRSSECRTRSSKFDKPRGNGGGKASESLSSISKQRKRFRRRKPSSLLWDESITQEQTKKSGRNIIAKEEVQ